MRRLRNRSHPLWTPDLVPRCLKKVCPSYTRLTALYTWHGRSFGLKLDRFPIDVDVFYPVLHPFVDEDESKKFRSSGNCRKPALTVGSLASRLECVASPESKHTKNIPQTDEKRGSYVNSKSKSSKREDSAPSDSDSRSWPKPYSLQNSKESC